MPIDHQLLDKPDLAPSVSASEPPCAVCPICGNRYGRVFSRDKNRRDKLSVWGEYIQCSECKHLYLVPVPEPGELAAFYEQLRRNESSADANNNPGNAAAQLARDLFARIEHKLFKSSFERYLAAHRFLPSSQKQSPSLLDMGCGEGITLAGFVDRGWALYGVDISPTAVEYARQRIPSGTFVAGELTDAARAFGPFEFVRLDNVLEHMIDPVSVLRAAYDQLSPGGCLAVYVPHGKSLSLRWFRSRSVSHWVPFHLHLFTRDSLKQALEGAGFNVLKFQFVDPTAWWTLTMSQALHPERALSNYTNKAMISIHLRFAAMPFRMLSRLAGGEELVAWAQKD